MFAIYSLSTVLFSKINSIFDTIVAFYNSKTFLSRVVEILEEEVEENGDMKHDLSGSITPTFLNSPYITRYNNDIGLLL